MQKQTYKTIHLQDLEFKEMPNSKEIGKSQLWSEYGRKSLLTYQQTCKATLGAHFDNGFFSAFLNAYNNHGDVKVTPDDVWIVIMLYFSKYVNDNSQKLRNAFVSHEGKKKLTVTTWKQTSQSQWDEFFTLMIQQIKKNTTKGVTENFQCNFTTTGRIEKLISTAAIMNTFQKYFSYGRGIPMCGIQNVHFGGTLQDWKKVFQKTQLIKEYDVDGKLKDYVKNISNILQKFIETYEGKVDLDFWNKIINSERGRIGSGSTSYYSGWLIHFFGYDKPTENVKLETIGFDIQIDNKLTGIKKDVRLVGGFRAVSKEGKIFRPHLSFAIQDSKQRKN